MLRLIIILLSLGLTACAARRAEDSTRANWHMQLGLGHLSKGQLPQALAEMIRADELSPKNPTILNNLGLAYFARGRPDLAEKSFRKALSIDQKLTDARSNLGRTLIELNRSREAVRELNLAAEDLLYAAPERVQVNLGLAHFKLKEFEKAQAAFEKALKVQRQDCSGWSYYGRTLYELSEYSRASSALDTAIEQCRSVKSGESFYFSALSYLKMGQKEKAVARLEESLSNDPTGEFAAKAKSMLEILR